jgi:hypothetical protein
MLTNVQLFFWHSHANFAFQSQMLFFPNYFTPFDFWTFFLSIFENPKYFLEYFFFNILREGCYKTLQQPLIITHHICFIKHHSFLVLSLIS